MPTPVLHRMDDAVEQLAGARYVAEHIPGAKLVELPGTEHAPCAGDQESVVREVKDFIARLREEEAEFKRGLTWQIPTSQP